MCLRRKPDPAVICWVSSELFTSLLYRCISFCWGDKGKYKNNVRIDVFDFRRSPDPRFLPYNTARYRILCSSYNWFSRDSLVSLTTEQWGISRPVKEASLPISMQKQHPKRTTMFTDNFHHPSELGACLCEIRVSVSFGPLVQRTSLSYYMQSHFQSCLFVFCFFCFPFMLATCLCYDFQWGALLTSCV